MSETATPRRVLVTGGGSGLGAAIVATLARAGYHVDFTYRREPGPAADHPGERWRCDFADPVATAGLAAELAARPAYWGLIHNAGMSHDALVPLLRLESARTLMDVNFWSMVTLAKALVPAMARQRAGRIVAIGSVAATRGGRGNAVYSASKAALDGFVRSLAAELAPRAVTVNLVAPGFIETAMTRSQADAGAAAARVPLKRFATPDEVADCVEFLLRPASGYITGSVLPIDGGLGTAL